MNKATLFSLVLASLIVLITVIYWGLARSPIFTKSLLLILLLVISYIMTERMATHGAAEFENRFWTFVAVLVSYTLVFVQDSPFYFISQWSKFLGYTVVFLISFWAHNYYRHLHRLVLVRATNFRRVQSSEFPVEMRASTEKKVEIINEKVKEIDKPWLSSSLLGIWNSVSEIEKTIVDSFDDTDSAELNLLLSRVYMGLIFYKIKDHTVFFRQVRQENRSRLLNMLFVKRLNELSVPSKAVLLDALMKLRLSAHPKCEQYAKGVILSLKDDELSELKQMMDSKLDTENMHKLIYTEIRNKTIREEILKHIQRQAEIQQAHVKIGSKNIGKRREQFAWRKILSDVDDTLLCSGGSFPAGVDRSYPKKAIYPGVLAFYRELDLGNSGKETWDTARPGNLVFLSARPHVYKDVSEVGTYNRLRHLHEHRGLYSRPTLLAGALDTGSQFVMTNNMEPLAKTKFQNLKEYLSVYPEFKCILVGDNGQGDVRTAEMVFQDQTIGSKLERVYIHEVRSINSTHVQNPSFRQRNNAKVCFFITYIDAAIDAVRHNLIRVTGLKRIMEESIDDFHHISDEEWKSSSQVKSKASLEGKKDSSLRSRHFELGYAGEPKKEARIRELNQALQRGNLMLIANEISPVPKIRFRQRFPVGSPVKTLFGVGVVSRFRSNDNIYEVLIQWDRTGIAKPTKGYFIGSSLQVAPTAELLTAKVAPKSNAGKDVSSGYFLSSYYQPPPKMISAIQTLPKFVQTKKPTAKVTSVKLTTNVVTTTSNATNAVAATPISTKVAVSDNTANNNPSLETEATNSESSAIPNNNTTAVTGNTSETTANTSTVQSVVTMTNPANAVVASTATVRATKVRSVDELLLKVSNHPKTQHLLKASLAMTPKSCFSLLRRYCGTDVYPSDLAIVPQKTSRPSNTQMDEPVNVLTSLASSNSVKCDLPTLICCTNLVTSNTGKLSHETTRMKDLRGSLVWTPYGNATVVDHRVSDDMLIVHYPPPWQAMGYIRRVFAVLLTTPADHANYEQQIVQYLQEWSQAVPKEAAPAVDVHNTDNSAAALANAGSSQSVGNNAGITGSSPDDKSVDDKSTNSKVGNKPSTANTQDKKAFSFWPFWANKSTSTALPAKSDIGEAHSGLSEKGEGSASLPSESMPVYFYCPIEQPTSETLDLFCSLGKIDKVLGFRSIVSTNDSSELFLANVIFKVSLFGGLATAFVHGNAIRVDSSDGSLISQEVLERLCNH